MAIEDIFKALDEQAQSECDAVARRGARAREADPRGGRSARPTSRTRASSRQVERVARAEAAQAASTPRGSRRKMERRRGRRATASRRCSTRRAASSDACGARRLRPRSSRRWPRRRSRASTGEVDVQVDPADVELATRRCGASGVHGEVAATSTPPAVSSSSRAAGTIIRRNTLEDRLEQVRAARRRPTSRSPVLMSEAVVTAGNRAGSRDGLRVRERARSRHAVAPAAADVLRAPHRRADVAQVDQGRCMETEYGADLEEQLIHGRTRRRRSTRRSRTTWSATYRKVLAFLNQEARKLLTTLLGRWDVFNIKTILRGKHMHQCRRTRSRRSFLPVGLADAGSSSTRLRSSTTCGVISTRWRCGARVRRAAAERVCRSTRRRDELAPLELALDRYYAEWAASQARRRGDRHRGRARSSASRSTRSNLVTVFRLLKADIERIEAESFFLEGGRVIRRQLFMRARRALRRRRGARPPQGHAVRRGAR